MGGDHQPATVVSGADLTLIRRGVGAAPLTRANGQGTGKFVTASMTADKVSVQLVDGRSGSATWTRSFDSFLPGSTGYSLTATAAAVIGRSSAGSTGAWKSNAFSKVDLPALT